MKSRKFVDAVTLYVNAGKGGNGCLSFRREKFVPKGGPDGGDGGQGGNVIFVGDRDEDSLVRLFYAPHQRAQDAEHGQGKKIRGRSGEDLLIKVPRGTEVWNHATGEMLGDIVRHGEKLLAARGGKGGLGNAHRKGCDRRALRDHTPGEPGEQITLRLHLKLMADVGLVGFPNAGKSSLLKAITDAHPKVGAYPFTTLNPIVGTVIFEDYSRLTIADIPGLLEGAHEGAGLGHDFLRHIERARFLVYVIDMAGSDGRQPFSDYCCLREELALHKAELADRHSITVANKMDLHAAAANLEEFRKETGVHPVAVSALTGQGLDELRKVIQTRFANKPG